ncbi:MAG: urease accessory protein UreD [Pseudomonadota bacterium]
MYQEGPPRTALQRTHGIGRISLRAQANQTRPKALYQEGAFKARLLQPPGQDHIDVALINTAGGLTGGDTMALEVDAGANTATALSTQACEKFYKSGGGETRITTRLTLSEDAALNWLPQEAILFDSSDVIRAIDVEMASTARLLMAESVLLGRSYSAEQYLSGRLQDSWSVRMNGRLVHCERLALNAESAMPINCAAKLGSYKAIATVLLITKNAQSFIKPVRQTLSSSEAVGGASAWRVGEANKLVVRLAARDGYALRKALLPVIAILGQGRTLPRLWNT